MEEGADGDCLTFCERVLDSPLGKMDAVSRNGEKTLTSFSVYMCRPGHRGKSENLS